MPEKIMEVVTDHFDYRTRPPRASFIRDRCQQLQPSCPFVVQPVRTLYFPHRCRPKEVQLLPAGSRNMATHACSSSGEKCCLTSRNALVVRFFPFPEATPNRPKIGLPLGASPRCLPGSCARYGSNPHEKLWRQGQRKRERPQGATSCFQCCQRAKSPSDSSIDCPCAVRSAARSQARW